MSLSISNSESPSAAGQVSAVEQGSYHAVELRWARRLCWLSPLIALIAIPIIDHYLFTVLYLKPADSRWQVVQAFQSKHAIAAALALAALPFIWLAGIKVDRPLRRSRVPWAVVLAAGVLIAAGVMLSIPRATWFFVQWAKVRTPNPSFARNTLFWEQRHFEQTQTPDAIARVGLVGSSQTNQGFHLEILRADCPEFNFEKNCLAGFGPMQYPFLQDRISERGFDTIVCHLSEFDFYREDVVPVERLRWAASLRAVAAIASTLTAKQQWENRSALADLTLASVQPLWRNREHFRRTLFGYWWNKSAPMIDDTTPSDDSSPAVEAQPLRLANGPVLEDAIVFLDRNIGRKEMVEANFESFALFAQHQRQRGVKLIVIEGQVHPKARAAYDSEGLQRATRRRLTTMAAAYGFEYVPSDQMPSFSAVDFADAYHLNQQGQLKISTFLAEQLRRQKTNDQ